jgi:hypothetical protein
LVLAYLTEHALHALCLFRHLGLHPVQQVEGAVGVLGSPLNHIGNCLPRLLQGTLPLAEFAPLALQRRLDLPRLGLMFGRDLVVRLSPGQLAVPRTARVLRLLDLRGEGARRAGLPELATRTADRDLSCAWSRHIYEDEATYGAVDGLIWASGRTGGACLALYQRARGALECPDQCSLPLSHPRLVDALLRIAQRHGYELR